MMHSGDEDDELCSADRFDSIEKNRNSKKKIRINSIEFGWIRSEIRFNINFKNSHSSKVKYPGFFQDH